MLCKIAINNVLYKERCVIIKTMNYGLQNGNADLANWAGINGFEK